MSDAGRHWPDLSLPALAPTCQTIQLWSQVVGKVRLACEPWLNHAWHVTLYVSARGVSTSLIHHPAGGFEIEFDLLADALVIRTTDGPERRVALQAQSLAVFHADVLAALAQLGLAIDIDPRPNELADATPFPEDHATRAYDPDAARAYWRALLQVDRVLKAFRTRFLGKSSPVHLFWGGFDIAVTRFSGRRAPLHPGGIPHLSDAVTREAYSHEVSSAGFWPGDPTQDIAPSFYAYAYPTPAGFADAQVAPPQAYFHPTLGEFLLPYDAVRQSPDPDAALTAFLQSTYEAAADLAHWDRAALECAPGVPGQPRPVR